MPNVEFYVDEKLIIYFTWPYSSSSDQTQNLVVQTNPSENSVPPERNVCFLMILSFTLAKGTKVANEAKGKGLVAVSNMCKWLNKEGIIQGK